MVVLGVLVVALSSRGHQIVFRYPLDAARDRPPPELLLAPAAAAAPAAPPPQQRLHTPAHSRRGSDAPQSKTASTYLGFDCGFLSDVLSPKLALRDRPFHLSIDSIDFVGLPTQLNANRPGTGLRFARLVQKRKAVAAVRAHEATAAAAAAADRGAAALPAHQHPLAAASAAAQSSASVSGQPDNPPPVASPALSLHTLDPHPSAVPRGPGAQGLPPAASAPPHKPLRAGTQSQLTMFNLVFAMQADSHSGSNYDLEMAAIYDNVIAKVTAALKYEQLRRGYLRKETELILAIKDEYHARHAAHAPASHTNQAGMPSPASDDHEQLEQHLQLLILRQSSLARCVAHIYHALRGQMSPHLQINDSVSLTIRTHGLTPDTLQLADIPLIDEPAPDSLKQLPKLRPYLALLLLHHPEEIIAMLPADASPLLVELIQAVTPTLSFEQLQTTLGCSLSQIYRLAAHLYVWGKARIIHVVNSRNAYVVSPRAQLEQLASLAPEFKRSFKDLDLLGVMQQLSTPQQLTSMRRENRNVYLEAITFLMRKNLVVQLHMYIYLQVPSEIYQKTDAKDNSQALWDASKQGPMIIANPASPTDAEKAWIAEIARKHPKPVSSLFLRLVPYFNGRVHADEILFRENIEGKDLKAIITRFKNELVTTLHTEDPA